MFQHIYVEEEIQDHSTTNAILARFPKAKRIVCHRYSEIFNRKAQNFRLQKQQPSLILAKKFQNFVLKIPQEYGIGGQNNYYFSYMLNCIFDCRYCFLQGMYDSANYVVFVNWEDFLQAMIEKLGDDPTYFFSGYDCDSLALESMTHFVAYILPFFEQHKGSFLELRTKSTNIRVLQKRTPIPNCIVAFTLSPETIVLEYEHKTPSLSARLQAVKTLQKQGWLIGLRFDPLLYCEDFKETYRHFFHQVFSTIDSSQLHSITLGVFRLPKPFFKKMVRLYPEEKLFAQVYQAPSDVVNKELVSYKKELSEAMRSFCYDQLLSHVSPHIIFSHEVQK